MSSLSAGLLAKSYSGNNDQPNTPYGLCSTFIKRLHAIYLFSLKILLSFQPRNSQNTVSFDPPFKNISQWPQYSSVSECIVSSSGQRLITEILRWSKMVCDSLHTPFGLFDWTGLVFFIQPDCPELFTPEKSWCIMGSWLRIACFTAKTTIKEGSLKWLVYNCSFTVCRNTFLVFTDFQGDRTFQSEGT